MLVAHSSPQVSPWAWHPHPDVWLLVFSLAALYTWAWRRARGVHEFEPRRVTAFAFGLAVLWISSDWPIHDIGENFLFSVHMSQHLLITLVAVPLLLLGVPTWLLRTLLVRPRPIYAVARRLSKPLIAGLIYNAVLVLSHWPIVVNGALEIHPLHFAVHVVLFVSAVLMWLPVINTLPELPSLSAPMRAVYLFLQSVIPTGPASFITFATGPVYSFYAEVPRPFSMTLIEDQQLAGAIMKVVGGLILWTAIAVVFFRWYRSEQDSGAPEATLTWADVERELKSSAPPPAEHR